MLQESDLTAVFDSFSFSRMGFAQTFVRVSSDYLIHAESLHSAHIFLYSRNFITIRRGFSSESGAR